LRNSYLDVVDPIIGANHINAIIGAEVGPSDGQMIYLQVLSKVKDDVKFGTVDEDNIVRRNVDR
jgi:hypothetical protein